MKAASAALGSVCHYLQQARLGSSVRDKLSALSRVKPGLFSVEVVTVLCHETGQHLWEGIIPCLGPVCLLPSFQFLSKCCCREAKKYHFLTQQSCFVVHFFVLVLHRKEGSHQKFADISALLSH